MRVHLNIVNFCTFFLISFLILPLSFFGVSLLISVGSKLDCFLPFLEEGLYHCQLSFQNCWAGIEFKDKCVLVPQSCLALCCPLDCSAPVFFVFSRQESLSGLPFLFQGISHPGNQPRSPTLQVDSLPQEAKFSLSTEHCR